MVKGDEHQRTILRRISDEELEEIAMYVSKHMEEKNKKGWGQWAVVITVILGSSAILQNLFLQPIKDQVTRIETRVERIDECFRNGDIVRREEFENTKRNIDSLREAIYSYRGNSILPERPLE